MKGFTLFFAMLVASLALAVGLAIYDLTVRELQLSSVATQSQYAIYAADTGAECALYWDSKCSLGGCLTGSAFATSSNTNGGSFPPAAGVICNTQDVAATGMSSQDEGSTPGWPGWYVINPGASSATTSFYISLAPQRSCAYIVVSKSGNPAQTTIVSHGYNTCTSGTVQIERVLQVTY